ncbi:helix-turn-helix domain-containing protein [Actinacidiphila sp. DG2A-62]|uniref:helix-turn-helix domain-containing protein n=1 Tax=Actinacidiphila sp. DG2A-62 TaxID=3108821 RepID=UPI002DB68E97|nr:helix-turn-helix domain-containing protein [Actinacidiphila sp. DG2A-62]MEC3998631.1 helix-turn-helix domain-containing protein [Actinacidiphila sp. DG2A-62]
MELNERVGRRLRELREDRGLSLSALARRSGTGKATLSELEAGRRNPTLETLYALTTALGVSLSAALTDPRAAAGAAGDGGGPGGPGGAAGAGGHAGISGAAVTAVLTERHEHGGAVTDVFRIRIRAGARQESAAHIPGTREHLVVLAGTAVVGDPAQPLTAGPGEHAHWAADAPHFYSAPHGDVEAVLFVRSPREPGPAAHA